MASIYDCRNRRVKIHQNSITIKKDDTNKTCGIVKNIISLHDIQPNKQIVYYGKLKKIFGHGCTNEMRNFIIKDDTLYYFKDLKPKLFHDKYGFFDDKEKEKYNDMENFCKQLIDNGIDVIECILT